MRLTWRDGVATVFVAAAAVGYGLWVTGIAMPGVSARVLGACVLGLGWAACTINQREMAVVYGVDSNRRRPPMRTLSSPRLSGGPRGRHRGAGRRQ